MKTSDPWHGWALHRGAWVRVCTGPDVLTAHRRLRHRANLLRVPQHDGEVLPAGEHPKKTAAQAARDEANRQGREEAERDRGGWRRRRGG
jgi:hypothetical protein